MNYFLAVDGGGTKTHVICADQEGNVVGEGMVGPASITSTSIGAAGFNLREGVRQATERLPENYQITSLVMGLAGMDTEPEKEAAIKTFSESLAYFHIHNFVLVNDIVIALESGTDNKNALALISGTGSNCYGRNQQGQSAKVSGLDFLLADQGSGYNIGWHVLKAAAKSYDGRGPKTILEQLLCEHFHVEDIEHLKARIYTPPLTKPEIAELSKVCHQALDQGDQVAKMIIDYQIREMMIMINTVAKKLAFDGTNFDCVLTGGVIQVDYVKQHLQAAISQKFPQAKVVFPEKEPVYGALKLALQQS